MIESSDVADGNPVARGVAKHSFLLMLTRWLTASHGAASPEALSECNRLKPGATVGMPTVMLVYDVVEKFEVLSPVARRKKSREWMI